MKVEEGVCITLEERHRAEGEDHTRIEAEKEARHVEAERLRVEEEEEDLRRKDEEEARLAEGARIKVEEHECTRMKVEGGVYLALESIQRAEE